MDQRKQTKQAFKRGQDDAKRRIEFLAAQKKLTSTNIQATLEDTEPSVISAQRFSDDEPYIGSENIVAQERDQQFDPAKEVEVLEAPLQAVSVEERTLQNLNTMLYVGSFLIVAAVALFVNFTMPAIVRLACIIVAAVAFYTAGIVLHAKSERLRPAAVAFVGTGLAILPFVGFALYSIGGVSSQVSWLVTSCIGIVAYGFAALRLQSQLVSYFTMAFVLAFSLSAVSTLGLAMVWYYIAVIGVALVCNCLYVLWPQRIPKVFSVPIEHTGQVMTPLALVASLLTAGTMDLFMYEVLYTVASLHYIVSWLLMRRWEYEIVARVLVHITGLLVMADISQQLHMPRLFAGGWLMLALLQALYSLLRVRRTDAKSLERESSVVAIVVGLLVVDIALWPDAASRYGWMAYVLLCIGIVVAAAAWRLRQAAWLYAGLAVTVILPLVVLRRVVSPAVGFESIALLFASLGALALIGVERTASLKRLPQIRQLLITASVTYGAFVVLSGIATNDFMHICWTMLVAAGLAVALSFLVASGAAVEMAGALLLVFSIFAGTTWLVDGSNVWRSMIALLLSTGTMTMAAAAHHRYAQRERRDGLIGIAAILFAGLPLTIGGSIETARMAVGLLVLGGVAMLMLRARAKGSLVSTLSGIGLVGYIVYPLLAVVIATGMAEAGWFVLAAGACAAILWASSYLERQPSILLVGHGFLLFALYSLWSWLHFDANWQPYGVLWMAAAVYYGWYWLSTSHRDSQRQQVSFVSVIIALTIAAVIGLTSTEQYWTLVGSGSVLAVAAIIAIEGYMKKSYDYVEVAIYIATAGLQRATAVILPETNLVAYGHWWAATVGMVALWRSATDPEMIRLKLALAAITASTGLYALSEGGLYSLVFLIEHLIVAVIGALMQKQWAMWWGIISVIVAILYFLRDYTALMLLFLGFLILLFVIWRLLKADDKKAK